MTSILTVDYLKEYPQTWQIDTPFSFSDIQIGQRFTSSEILCVSLSILESSDGTINSSLIDSLLELFFVSTISVSYTHLTLPTKA